MALTTDLISYWKLDEETGNAIDSHSTNNGTLVGGVLQNQDGKIIKAYSFDGIDDNVDCGSDVSLQPTTALTISCWIKPAEGQEKYYDGESGNFGVAGSVDGADETSTWSWQLRYGKSAEDTSLGFQLATNLGPKWATLNENLVANTWNYIVVTFNGTTLKIYLNGVLKDTNEIGKSTINVNEANKILLGVAGWGVSNTYYTGLIDEFGIFGVELTSTEVLKLYNNSNGFAYPLTQKKALLPLVRTK